MHTSTPDRGGLRCPIDLPFDGELVLGSFVERLNRFVARVLVNGDVVLAHVPNSGRMNELLVRGTAAGVIARPGTGRKTPWQLAIVQHGDVWVGVDSLLANRVVRHLLDEALVSSSRSQAIDESPVTSPMPRFPCETWGEAIKGLTKIRREARLGRHVIDFLLEKGERQAYLEVKSVNLVQDRIALFPDAPTTRGREHVDILSSLSKRGVEAYLIFVVQRSDAQSLAPNRHRDPDFARALWHAAEAGVRVAALSCKVLPQGVRILGRLPVDLE